VVVISVRKNHGESEAVAFSPTIRGPPRWCPYVHPSEDAVISTMAKPGAHSRKPRQLRRDPSALSTVPKLSRNRQPQSQTPQ